MLAARRLDKGSGTQHLTQAISGSMATIGLLGSRGGRTGASKVSLAGRMIWSALKAPWCGRLAICPQGAGAGAFFGDIGHHLKPKGPSQGMNPARTFRPTRKSQGLIFPIEAMKYQTIILAQLRPRAVLTTFEPQAFARAGQWVKIADPGNARCAPATTGHAAALPRGPR
jgi:hypothetical protein